MAPGYGMEYYFHLRKSFYSVDTRAAALTTIQDITRTMLTRDWRWTCKRKSHGTLHPILALEHQFSMNNWTLANIIICLMDDGRETWGEGRLGDVSHIYSE